MPKIEIIGNKCPNTGRMLVRGAFSQKKKAWNAIEQLIDASSSTLLNDVNGKTMEAKYDTFCQWIRENGRVAFVDENGDKTVQVVEGEMNELRGVDIDENGTPVQNPTGG